MIVALAWLLLPVLLVRGERVPMIPEQLTNGASHIVVGKVTGIYQKVAPVSKGFQDTHYVAEVRVIKSEKGGLATDSLVYARYWRRAWAGPGIPPPDTVGYLGIPKENEVLRLFLIRNGYTGFNTTSDGGFTVLGPNGFSRDSLDLPPPAK